MKIATRWLNQVRMQVRTNTLIFGCLIACCLVFGSRATNADNSTPMQQCQATAFDPIAAYGNEIHFDVRRNDKPVGFHEVSFLPNGDSLRVIATFSLEINFLFINAYHYHYRSESVWKDGCLVELNAEIDDNGAKTSIDVQREGDTLRIDGPSGVRSAEFGIFPTDHWHPGVLAASRVLNTIKGRVDDVEIVREGEAVTTTGSGNRSATHYRYTGDLRNEVWYDDQNRWVKMRFEAKDDSIIDYVCRSCGARQGQAS